ncbi:MAG: replication-associated recombination protein A [Acidobacteria bacterium]|nr:replication-associated recombination protein A [Acidobacteriota bacterium]MYK89035.1 replication-associated recombination protein A [Acidobacteriota bacterium]
MKSGHLFESAAPDGRAVEAPLAERMRPRTFEELVGQQELLAPGRPLRAAIERDALQSIILWGPPGTGKTTIARLIATVTRAHFIAFSAVLSGIKDIKAVMAEAQAARRELARRTILFVDEIHRFNKAQQDAFLPRVEAGDIALIGATTENPSFEVNAALLSRSKVFVLQPLATDETAAILRRALADPERGLGSTGVAADDDALAAIARHASGDARVALNLLELAATLAGSGRIDRELLARAIQKRALLYDKSGDEHFNLISALHKSLRNSDPDAGVYWLARMIEAGEEPLYIARRLVRFASEDVGNADPNALAVAVAAKEAVHFIGMPEGNTALAQAVTYLATAPKSNAVYAAYNRAAADAHEQVAEPVPLHLRNAPTRLMKEQGYGDGYAYAHDDPDGVTGMDCLPPALAGRRYYRPTTRGYEKEVARRLDAWRALKRAKGQTTPARTEEP